MIIVADSGSTKTAWAVGDPGKPIKHLECEGLNPHFTHEGRYLALGNWLRGAMVSLCPTGPMESVGLYFYGAGCGTREAQERVERLLKQALPEAEVTVAGDLLGACRALYGQEAGVVGILGTGSNACYYDGKNINRQTFSTGYILGDEGSGNHIGRKLLKSYLTKRMPESLMKDFESQYPKTAAEFLNLLYKEPNPNRFLASLAPFASKHRGEPFIQQLLVMVFDEYLIEQVLPIMPTEKKEIRCVGSVAAVFAKELGEVATRHGIRVVETIAQPLERLMAYHIDI